MLVCLPTLADGQKVANYFFGKYGTKACEYFPFWVEADKPAVYFFQAK